jgi:hypothetical protein
MFKFPNMILVLIAEISFLIRPMLPPEIEDMLYHKLHNITIHVCEGLLVRLRIRQSTV